MGKHFTIIFPLSVNDFNIQVISYDAAYNVNNTCHSNKDKKTS